MNLLSLPDYILKRGVWIGLFAIIISVVTWTMDLTGVVYTCPYCRMQRSVIGLLGVILLLPFCYHWLLKLVAMSIGFFGAVVGANQHFRGWVKVSSGEFKFNQTLWTDPTILSGFAICIIVFLTCVVLQKQSSTLE